MKKKIIVGMFAMMTFLLALGVITVEQYIETEHIVGISKYGFVTEID